MGTDFWSGKYEGNKSSGSRMDFDVKRGLKEQGERVWTQESPVKTVTVPLCMPLT